MDDRGAALAFGFRDADDDDDDDAMLSRAASIASAGTGPAEVQLVEQCHIDSRKHLSVSCRIVPS